MFIQMKLFCLVSILSKLVLDIALADKNENSISWVATFGQARHRIKCRFYLTIAFNSSAAIASPSLLKAGLAVAQISFALHPLVSKQHYASCGVGVPGLKENICVRFYECQHRITEFMIHSETEPWISWVMIMCHQCLSSYYSEF